MLRKNAIHRFRCALGLARPSLIEDHAPEEGPTYQLDLATPWPPDRARMWVAILNLLLLALTIGGLFVLILVGQDGSGLLVWQGAMSIVSTLSATVTTYYFAKRDEAPAGWGNHEIAQHIRSTAIKPSSSAGARTHQPLALSGGGTILSVALIGSFRQHYDEVTQAAAAFTAAGVHVLSPAIATIINPGAEFVRFDIDPAACTDAELQERALSRILAADFVYVVAPGGYIGRTTCYELGQVLKESIPVFFSDLVGDLPIRMPASQVRDAAELAHEVAAGGVAALRPRKAGLIL